MKPDESKNNLVEIRDILLASSLVAEGFVCEGTKRLSEKRVAFLFLPKNEIQSTIDRFWKKELRFEPQHLMEQVKSLKARIYSTG